MKTAMITFKLSEVEKEQLIALAQKNDVALSQIVREAIREYIQKEEKNERT